MSRTRQSSIALETFPLDEGERFDEHTHETHQLAWVSEGVLMVSIGERNWILPPSLALWIPAGVPHSTTAVRAATLKGIYLADRPELSLWAAPTVVAVTNLLRELITHLDGELPDAARDRAEALVPDLLSPVSTLTIEVPMPIDGRAARIARGLLDEPRDARDLDAWGRAVGASTRTLSRIFAAETGLGFTQWRTRLRIRHALGRLADGDSVSQVAARVGYASPSAFIASFRRVTGLTPGEYFEQVDDLATSRHALASTRQRA